jgi:hypothetical protein
VVRDLRDGIAGFLVATGLDGGRHGIADFRDGVAEIGRTGIAAPSSRSRVPPQLFVSRYLVALPSPEDLQRLVEADRALLEQRHDGGEESG